MRCTKLGIHTELPAKRWNCEGGGKPSTSFPPGCCCLLLWVGLTLSLANILLMSVVATRLLTIPRQPPNSLLMLVCTCWKECMSTQESPRRLNANLRTIGGKKKVYSTVPYKSEPNYYQTSFSILCRVLVGPETPFVEKLNVLPSYPRHDILITGTRVPAGRNGEVIEDTEWERRRASTPQRWKEKRGPRDVLNTPNGL